MQKVIQKIIEMTDSNILNENGNTVATTPYEETVENKVDKEVKTETNDSSEKVENTSGNDTNATETTNVEESKETKVEETVVEDVTEVEEVQEIDDPRDDDMALDYLDKDFVYECMAVPTHSKEEWRMVEFIILWARRNKITYEFDDFGNVYLTKGELAEGEYYPCVTSHMDTVHHSHVPYIYAGVPLDLKTERTKDNTHKVSVESYDGASIGVGADDKGGVCICLSLFAHLDKLKACFFLDEETGCHGSDNLWADWFKDVGYVIGYDSPELYRAAWSCSGTKLFSYEFYTKYMKEICDKWGLTKGCFFSEPYTDVKNIRKKVEVICMNFGNGGYNPHGPTEYFIMEDMDQACGMGLELIENIGCTRHYLKDASYTSATSHTYRRGLGGVYEQTDVDDTELLKGLGDNCRTGYYGYSSVNRGSSTTTTTTTTTKKEDEIKMETVKYIVSRYDSHIDGIKNDLLESIKELCETGGIDFAQFETVINDKFNNEIKF